MKDKNFMFNSGAMEKGLNSIKILIKKVDKYMETKSLDWLFFMVFAYSIYFIGDNQLCLNKDCFVSINNTFWLILIGFYIYLFIKFLFRIKSNEDIDKNIKELSKEKLELEINDLKNNQSP